MNVLASLLKLLSLLYNVLTGNENLYTCITVGFCTATFVLFIVYIIMIWRAYNDANKKCKSYHNLLMKTTQDNLAEERMSISERASKFEKDNNWPALWLEFDETLIEIDGHLQNTVDADHFFNCASLASGLVNNRNIIAGATILTGLGVLGTFVGLMFGLTHVDLGSDNIKDMQASIAALIAGASTAFTTSVFGVFFSMALGFIEKQVDTSIKKKISKLQQRIDELFPRFSVAQVFADIRKDGSQSRNTLQGLAEKIGDRMQEAVQGVGTTIQASLESSLREVLLPAIESLGKVTSELASRHANSAEEAMSQLVTRFMDSVGKEGNNQRMALEGAAMQIQSALGSMSKQMDSFMQSIEKQRESIQQESRARDEVLSSQQQAHLRQQEEQLSTVQRTMSELMAALQRQNIAMLNEQDKRHNILEGYINTTISNQKSSTEHASMQMAAQTEMVQRAMSELLTTLQLQNSALLNEQDKRHNILEDYINSTISNQKIMADHSSKQMAAQTESVKALLAQGGNLADLVSGMQKEMTISTGNLQSVTDGLRRTSDGINKAVDVLASSLTGVASKVETSIAATTSLMQENTRMANNVNAVFKELQQINEGMAKTTDSLDKSVNTASRSYNELAANYAKLQGVLQTYVQDIKTGLENILKSYGEQVSSQTTERLSEWNKQTREFCETMTDATQAIAEIVDQVGSKPGSR